MTDFRHSTQGHLPFLEQPRANDERFHLLRPLANQREQTSLRSRRDVPDLALLVP